jgi:CRP-like cAMP-binding protein
MAIPAVDLSLNHLLASLEPAALSALQPYQEVVDLRLSESLTQAGKPIRHVYFPLSGMISLVQSFEDGTTAEVGLIGREGFSGSPLMLGARSSPAEAMVQGAGTAVRIPASAFLAAVDTNAALRTRLLQYVQMLHVQVALTAACNGRHKVRQRLARWLLEAQDRLGGTQVPLSHEFLSYMLGVRRAGVTTVLSSLRSRGIISTNRGHIGIRSRKSVEAEACECYRIVKAEAGRLLPKPSRAR